MLIVTNGSSAAGLISQVYPEASVLSWDDVLHDGPVPTLNLDNLTEVRAEFLQSFDPYRDVLVELQTRNERLKKFRDHDEVVLCFEHDLYDMLQLCQVLDFFNGTYTGATRLSLALNEVYLGESSGAEIEKMMGLRVPVRSAQLETASGFWTSFTSTDHSGMADEDWSSIPFLGQNVVRLLEEYPSVCRGLARSRSQILEILADGPSDPAELFLKHGQKEEARYLGDASFFSYVKELEGARHPLIKCSPGRFELPGETSPFRDQVLELTGDGRDVSDCKKDAVLLNGIYHWIGGVRLTPCLDRIPRWDPAEGRLV